MTAAAFIRIESFARVATTQPGRAGAQPGRHERTWTVDDVIGELTRRPGNIPHIDVPEPPVLLMGRPAEEVGAEAAAMAARGRDLRGRCVKKDAKILTCIVASWHEPWAEVRLSRANTERLDRWCNLTVDFVRKEFGDRLACAVLHTDEGRPNIHLLLLPSLTKVTLPTGDEIEHFSILPVDRLRAAAKAAKRESGGNGREAAARAASAFQNRYVRDVGYQCGQTRGDGSAGPRQSRTEALFQRRVREETATLTAEISRLDAEVRRLGQAAVIDAAEKRAASARYGPNGRSRAAKLTDKVRLAAILRIPDGHLIHRISDDGTIKHDELDGRPGVEPRFSKSLHGRLEVARGDEAAIAAYRDALGYSSSARQEAERSLDAARQNLASLNAAIETQNKQLKDELDRAELAIRKQNEESAKRQSVEAELESLRHAFEAVTADLAEAHRGWRRDRQIQELVFRQLSDVSKEADGAKAAEEVVRQTHATQQRVMVEAMAKADARVEQLEKQLGDLRARTPISTVISPVALALKADRVSGQPASPAKPFLDKGLGAGLRTTIVDAPGPFVPSTVISRPLADVDLILGRISEVIQSAVASGQVPAISVVAPALPDLERHSHRLGIALRLMDARTVADAQAIDALLEKRNEISEAVETMAGADRGWADVSRRVRAALAPRVLQFVEPRLGGSKNDPASREPPPSLARLPMSTHVTER